MPNYFFVQIWAADEYNRTPLWEALEAQHYDLARYIYNKGGLISPDKQDETLACKLCFFVYRQDYEAIE